MGARITPDLLERERAVRPFIEKYGELTGIDPNLVRALITQESRFIADAVSPTGAYGYGQFTNIGAKQVREIARIHNPQLFGDLINFQKSEANDPDRGIKAIYAFLWWLLNVKFKNVEDEQTRLEAALTYYNAGGRPAALIVAHGGLKNALEAIKNLPARYRSQADRYALEALAWYVAWHEHMQAEEREKEAKTPPVLNTGGSGLRLDPRYRALIEALKLLADEDVEVEVFITSRDGLTEVSLLLPGEYLHERS